MSNSLKPPNTPQRPNHNQPQGHGHAEEGEYEMEYWLEPMQGGKPWMISTLPSSPTKLGRECVVPPSSVCKFVSREAAFVYVNSEEKAVITVYSTNPLRIRNKEGKKKYNILLKGQTYWMKLGDELELAYDPANDKGHYAMRFIKKPNLNKKKERVRKVKAQRSSEIQSALDVNPRVVWLAAFLKEIDDALKEYAEILEEQGFSESNICLITYEDMVALNFKLAHARILEDYILKTKARDLEKQKEEIVKGGGIGAERKIIGSLEESSDLEDSLDGEDSVQEELEAEEGLEDKEEEEYRQREEIDSTEDKNEENMDLIETAPLKRDEEGSIQLDDKNEEDIDAISTNSEVSNEEYAKENEKQNKKRKFEEVSGESETPKGKIYIRDNEEPMQIIEPEAEKPKQPELKKLPEPQIPEAKEPEFKKPQSHETESKKPPPETEQSQIKQPEIKQPPEPQKPATKETDLKKPNENVSVSTQPPTQTIPATEQTKTMLQPQIPPKPTPQNTLQSTPQNTQPSQVTIPKPHTQTLVQPSPQSIIPKPSLPTPLQLPLFPPTRLPLPPLPSPQRHPLQLRPPHFPPPIFPRPVIDLTSTAPPPRYPLTPMNINPHNIVFTPRIPENQRLRVNQLIPNFPVQGSPIPANPPPRVSPSKTQEMKFHNVVPPSAEDPSIVKLRTSSYPWNIKEWKQQNRIITVEAIAKYYNISVPKKKSKELTPIDTSLYNYSEEEIKNLDFDKQLKKILKTQLFDHQKEALTWMLNREAVPYFKIKGGMLCDEMGLGKTLCILTLIALDIAKRNTNLKNKKKQKSCPSLIVCSMTLLNVWEKEIEKHFKANCINYTIFHRKKAQNLTVADLEDLDVVITTYDTVRGPFSKMYKSKTAEILEMAKKVTNEKDWESEKKKLTPKINEQPLFVEHTNGIGNKLLLSYPWRRVICDEAHEFRNPTTLVARTVRSIKADRRWYVSGTPIQNNSDDLYSALKFLQIEHKEVSSKRAWRKLINKMTRQQMLEPGEVRLTFLDRLLALIMLKRTKEDVYNKSSKSGSAPSKLDPIQLVVKKAPFKTPEENDLYRIYKGEAAELWQGYVTKTAEFASVLVALTRMRQACVSPLLLPSETRTAIIDKNFESGKPTITPIPSNQRIVHINDGVPLKEPPNPRTDPPPNKILTLKELCARFIVSNFITFDPETVPTQVIDIINGVKATLPAIYSTKFLMLLDYLKSIPADDKVILFSEWTSAFGPLAAVLSGEKYGWVQVDGGQTVEVRKKNMDLFDTEPDIRVLLLSLKIGSSGLTLVSANHCIFLEPWWNPFVHSQAEARAHRSGQTKQVYSVYLIIEGTVEEKVVEINEQKKRLATEILESGGKRQNMVSLDASTVKDLIFEDDEDE